MPNMLLIPAEGTKEISFVTFPDGDWRGMAKAIGADYIERVRVGDAVSLAVDEEGLYTDKAINSRACLLYGTPTHGAPIIGDVLFGIEEMGPEGVDWTDDAEEVIRIALGRAFARLG